MLLYKIAVIYIKKVRKNLLSLLVVRVRRKFERSCPQMPLTKFEKHNHLLKYGIIGISNAILRKYSTEHAPCTIGDSGCL